MSHIRYMRAALRYAKKAMRRDEVPIAAVVVHNDTGEIIAHGINMREATKSPLAHAEVIAIARAAKKLGHWNLHKCSIYVTLEPCLMCLGCILEAKIKHIYFGAYDTKPKAYTDGLNSIRKQLHKRVHIKGGILGRYCAYLLRRYFKHKRKK